MTGVPVAELAPLPLLDGAPAPALEHLAALLSPVEAAPGEVLVREGEHAHDFVLVRGGAAEVAVGGAPLAVLGAGELVGELALLRRVPRTATVTATAPLTGWRGGENALAALLDVPGAADRLARTA